MLSQFLPAEIFAFLLVFCRLGSAIMLIPGIGEIYVPMRIRLLFALGFSAVLMPVLQTGLPPLPANVGTLVALIASEITIGIFIGALARTLISAVHTAGTVIATQSGLASAMMMDFTQTSQSTSVTNLLAITALTLFFAMDLDHLIFVALQQSYDVFQAGVLPPVDDISNYLAHTVSRTFGVAMQLSAPFIVVSLVLNFAGGILSRLMPAMQIFFIMMPAQIMLNFFVMMITISGVMIWYMNYLEEQYMNFIVVP